MKVYLSSTFKDLEEHRRQAYQAMRSQRLDVIAMEDYVARDERPMDRCLADVAAADLYVGIFAFRYGYIPETGNPESLSITELEYRHAVKHGVYRLVFLAREEGWSLPLTDFRTGEGDGGRLISRLREELERETSVGYFTTPDRLRAEVSGAVSIWRHSRGAAQPVAVVPGGLREVALSPDVQAAYRLSLDALPGGAGAPVDWTLEELSALRRRVETDERGASEKLDLLTALCEALAAKPVVQLLVGGRLGIGQLQVTYKREIGAWPVGNSADALLIEAASVGIAERRPYRAVQPLGALARYVVGLTATLKAGPPQEGDLLAEWIAFMGHQLADARQYYDRRLADPAWLVVDLGDEPGCDESAWPTTVTWTRLAKDGEPITGKPVTCDPTPEGLRAALTEILQLAGPAHPLLVDLVLPRDLMDEGIQYWPIQEVDGRAEPLRAESRPRLRWSKRRKERDAPLYSRLVDRARAGLWDGEALQWLHRSPRRACLLGGPTVHGNQLREILREGCGFVIWFPSGLPGPAVIAQIDRAIRDIPVSARRDHLPEWLPSFKCGDPAIIWDDPEGRGGGFSLPPLVEADCP